MTKTSNLIIAVTAMTMTLTGCSSDPDQPADDHRVAPLFAASISNGSRAFDSQWEKGDAIGISGASRTNVSHTTSAGDGHFTVSTPGEEIYFQDENATRFTAYWPYSATASAPEAAITADTREQGHQKSFDFLWAEASASKAAPEATLAFTHRMARVVITLRAGADVSYDELCQATLSLEGVRHEGSFDPADGSTATAGNPSGSWTLAGSATEAHNAPAIPDREGGTVSYTMILFPQRLDAPLPFHAGAAGKQTFSASLDFTGANRTAGDANPENAWIAGRQYHISVTLHKTAVAVDGCTIEPWEPVDGGNVNAGIS